MGRALNSIIYSFTAPTSAFLLPSGVHINITTLSLVSANIPTTSNNFTILTTTVTQTPSPSTFTVTGSESLSTSSASTYSSSVFSSNTSSSSQSTFTVTVSLTSSISTNLSSVSNNTPSSSRSLPLGPIIGGLLAVLVLLLLLLFLLLKHLSLRRGIRSRAETDSSTLTPFGFNPRERSGSYLSVSDGPRSATAGLASPLMTALIATTAHPSQGIPPAPDSIVNDALTPNTFPIPPRKLGASTTYAAYPPIQDEKAHLATHTSDPETNQEYFQLKSSNDFTTNGVTREERASHIPIYISNPNETRSQIAFTNISTNSDHASVWESAPPAYDSLSSRISHANPSRR